MELVVYDQKHNLPKSFARWFLKRLKQELIRNMDVAKVKLWDDYLNSSYEEFKLYPVKLKADKIVQLGINNIVISVSPDHLTYRINSTVLVPGLDRIKVIDLCKIINYGTLSQEGYPLFTITFNQIQANFNQYIKEYIM